MNIALDASVTLSWLLRDAASREAVYPWAILEALRGSAIIATVPMTWGLEVSNVIARVEAMEKISAARSGSFLTLVDGIALDVDAHTFAHVFGDTLQLSRRYKLSSYDASYLELALCRGVPIARSGLRTFAGKLLHAWSELPLATPAGRSQPDTLNVFLNSTQRVEIVPLHRHDDAPTRDLHAQHIET